MRGQDRGTSPHLPDSALPYYITEPFIEKIKISEKIQPKVVTKDNGDGTITTTFYYDDYKFIVKVEVEAIQTHNADKAIQATWGVDPTSKGMDVSYEQIVEDYE